MTIRRLLPLLALAAAPAFAATTGPAQRLCLILDRVQNQRIVDDRTILFQEGSKWYRNDLAAPCLGLTPERSLRSMVPTSRLCAGDPVTVFERVSNFTYGACPLGRFTRIPAPGAPPH